MSMTEPILFVHDGEGGRALIERLRRRTPLFVCVVAHTDLCEVPGISAAGATPELRRYTAAADLEMLRFGRPRCLEGVPVNPLGPPSPVLITAAALRLAGMRWRGASAGLRVRPDVPLDELGERPGADIRSGPAVSNAAELFEAGQKLGRRLAGAADYLLVGESVPGGTTTALALMLALGLDARGKVSSSFAENPSALKSELVDTALANAWPGGRPAGLDPLAAVAAVGDPMQPAAAGLALGALAAGADAVVLAGGTQMAAVAALMEALERRSGRTLPRDRLAVATTRWVATDPTADLAGLARQIRPIPFLAANLDFSASRHPALRRYEEFLVKEGVGAGGAAMAAMLATGLTPDALLVEVEAIYDRLHT